MVGHFLVGRELDALLGGFGGDRCGIGDDQSGDEFAFVAYHYGVQDEAARLEGVFDGLWGDEFAGGGFDQVFFAVGDEEIVVFVEIADVAGAEPAVGAQDFAGGFGAFVVALHDARAFG